MKNIKNIKNLLKILSLFLVLAMGSKAVLGMYPSDPGYTGGGGSVVPRTLDPVQAGYSFLRLVSALASSCTDNPSRVGDFFANATRLMDSMNKPGGKSVKGASIANIANLLTSCCDVLDEYAKKVDPITKKAVATRTKAKKAALILLALIEGGLSLGAASSYAAGATEYSRENSKYLFDVAALVSILHSFMATNNKHKKAMCLLLMVFMISAELEKISYAALDKYHRGAE